MQTKQASICTGLTVHSINVSSVTCFLKAPLSTKYRVTTATLLDTLNPTATKKLATEVCYCLRWFKCCWHLLQGPRPAPINIIISNKHSYKLLRTLTNHITSLTHCSWTVLIWWRIITNTRSLCVATVWQTCKGCVTNM